MENIGGGAFGRPVEQPSYLDPHKTSVFYITSVYSTPFQWFLCKKSSIDWVTHPSKNVLLTLSNKWMDSYGAAHVDLQDVFGWLCNSVNTGLFAQKSLKGCRMDWCDVGYKSFVWIWVTGLFHGPSKCAAPYVFHSLARSQSTPLAKVYTFSHRKSMGKSDHLPKVHT